MPWSTVPVNTARFRELPHQTLEAPNVVTTALHMFQEIFVLGVDSGCVRVRATLSRLEATLLS